MPQPPRRGIKRRKRRETHEIKSFLVLFFKKEHLAFFATRTRRPAYAPSALSHAPSHNMDNCVILR
jgi:hypothetical protein